MQKHFGQNMYHVYSLQTFLVSFLALSLKSFKVRWQYLQIQDLRLQSFGRLIGTIKKVLSHKWSAGRKLRNWKMQLFGNVSPQMDLRHDSIFRVHFRPPVPKKSESKEIHYKSLKDHTRPTIILCTPTTGISCNTAKYDVSCFAKVSAD